MGWLSDHMGFEKFHLGNIWDKLEDEPERAFIGAWDPFSSKMWGEILHKDYDPIIDQMGGPTEDDYNGYEAEGGNAGPSHRTHDVAHVVAGLFAGNYGYGKLGDIFGGGGSLSADGVSSGGGTGGASGAGKWLKLAGAGMNGFGSGMGNAQQPEMVSNIPLDNPAPTIAQGIDENYRYQPAENYNPYVQGLLNYRSK